MRDMNAILAGFGGQGILFMGKVIAYAGLYDDKQVSWLPSYGPEMRGGTANCNVILSDAPVGSPIVNTPNVLMVMNNPSLDKYENAVQPGGKIFLDSTLIARKVTRTDVEAYYVPATKMAMDMGMPTLANMILLGALIAKTGCVREESLTDALHKVIPARKADLFDLNMQALQAGKEFAEARNHDLMICHLSALLVSVDTQRIVRDHLLVDPLQRLLRRQAPVRRTGRQHLDQ